MKRRMAALARFIYRNRVYTKSISFILSLVLIFYVIPSTIYAKAAEIIQRIDENNAETATDISNDDEYDGSAYELLERGIYEVIEKREENVKHFRLADGTFIAAQYDYPVHYLDENGEWQDIDNSLSESGSEFSNSDAKIKFAKKITGNETLFTLHDGSSKITLSLLGAKKGTKGTVTNNSDSNTDTELQKMMNLENISSSIIYEDILNGVDIEYVVHSKNVKENIIVKKKNDSYLYSFELKLNELTPTLTQSGDVELCDNVTGDIKYLIPAPVVYDSVGNYAPYDVAEYTLNHEKGGKYILGVSVNAEWMNSESRVFPVTVDPTIKAPVLRVIDTYIDSSSPEDSWGESNYLYVSDEKISFWKCQQMPDVPVSAFITQANIAIATTSADTHSGYVGVYEVTTSWNESLTWNEHVNSNKGAISSIATDYCVINGAGTYYFDVTEIILNWYDNRQGWYFNQHGLAFKAVEGYDANLVFYSNNCESLKPTLAIYYVDMKGIEGYWPYSSHSTEAGAGSINLANGNLVFTIPTLTTTDSLFSYTPTLVYNSCIYSYKYHRSTTVLTAYSYSSAARGFKINACETVIEKIERIDPNNPVHYYIYADADGTEHELHETNTDGVFKDIDGLGLFLTVYDDLLELSNDEKTIRRFRKIEETNTYLWESNWYLTEIEEIGGNKLIFAVDDCYRPTAIKLLPKGASSDTEMLKLLYTSDGTLCAVYNPTSKQSVIIRYSRERNYIIAYEECNYLRKVEYCYGNDSTTESDVLNFATTNNSNPNIFVYDTNEYDYDNEGRLSEVKNSSSGMILKYEWDENRVIKVSEYSGETIGRELEMSYDIRYTEVRSCGNDDTLGTSDDIRTCYTLDGYGRAISGYSCTVDGKEILGGTSGIYDTKEDSKNYITQKTVLGHVRENLLLNGDFSEEDINSSTVSNWITAGVAKETGNNIENPEELLLSMLPTATSPATVSQNITLDSGEYTFSMKYATKKCKNILGKVEIIDQATSAVLYSADILVNELDNEKNEIFSTHFIITEITPITLRISFTASGTINSGKSINIGQAKLECGDSVSDYTIISAGGFNTDNAPNYWNANTGSISLYTDDTGNRSLKLTANGGENYVKQTLLLKTQDELEVLGDEIIDGLNPDLQFAISGYAKADYPLPTKDFRIYVEITYYRGESLGSSTEIYPVNFSTITDKWQYACGTFSLSKNSEGESLQDYICVQSVNIVCDYSNQLFGDAYFDDIAITYIGNDKTEHTEYENGLVVKSGNGIYCTYYEYNAKRNVKRIADSNGNLIDYRYRTDNVNLVDYTTQYTYTYLGSPNVYPYKEDNPNELIEKTAKFKTYYTYNSYGMVTEVATYVSVNNFTKQDYTYETTVGSKIFGALLTETNANTANKYFYDNAHGWLLAYINTKSSLGYAYTYDETGKLIAVDRVVYAASSDTYSDEQDSSTLEYEYDGADRLSSITTGSTTYTLTYDVFGKSESISIGDRELAEYEYNENNGKLKRIIYGNGYEVEYAYNDLEQMQTVRYRTDANSEYISAYEYEYTSDGQIHSFKDNINSRTTIYRYDGYDRFIGISEYEDNKDVIHTEISYDDNSRIGTADTSISYYFVRSGSVVKNTEAVKYTYSYLDDSRLAGYTISNGITTLLGLNVNVAYSYDTLDRVTKVEYNNTRGSSLSISNEYEYSTDATYGTSGRINAYTSTVGNDSQRYTYTYDEDGNITKITYSDGKTIEYEYDIYGRVVSETNEVFRVPFTYSYDNAGNIIQTTTGAVTNTYSYTDSEWGDLLTSYKGVDITYDEIGNPLSYYNGSSYTFTWQGRRLMTATKGTKNMSFEYNSDGLRISKTVNGATTYYVYDGDLLVAEYTDTRAIVYIYDANGSPIGFKYRTNSYAQNKWDVYWYGKNLQGDILAVYDSTGTKVISYEYNAWGITKKTAYASTTAIYNCLTYRGYYYDNDLNMYYLQSRYYDSNICRFINADGLISGISTTLQGYNLYVYCFNNPITYIDSNGDWPTLSDVWGWIEDNIIDPVKQFCDDISEDVDNYDKENKDPNTVFESNYFSSYNGTLVIITPFAASFSFGFIGLSNVQKNTDTLNHEHGHKLQLKERGWGEYITDIAIPSVTINILDRKGNLTYDYYSYPWEAEANRLGGSTLSEDKPKLPENEYSYWDLIPLFFE